MRPTKAPLLNSEALMEKGLGDEATIDSPKDITTSLSSSKYHDVKNAVTTYPHITCRETLKTQGKRLHRDQLTAIFVVGELQNQ